MALPPHFARIGGEGDGAAKRFGVPRPFAGMTRIRFKGFGV
jgi:hypothetical protein